MVFREFVNALTSSTEAVRPAVRGDLPLEDAEGRRGESLQTEMFSGQRARASGSANLAPAASSLGSPSHGSWERGRTDDFSVDPPQENKLIVKMSHHLRRSPGTATQRAGCRRHLENSTINSNFTGYTVLQGKALGG